MSDRHPDRQPAAVPAGDAEQRALDALAAELRAAVPVDAPLSPSFAGRLEERLEARPWELRSALRERPLLRVAAALLVISTVAAPVSALVLLLRPQASPDPVLQFELPAPLPEIESPPQDAESPAVPPHGPGMDDLFGPDWQAALGRSNRMAVVVAEWHETHPELSAAAPAPARLAWAEASDAEILAEFRRRATLGITAPLPASLRERVTRCWADAPADEALAPELRAWRWVLEGDGPPPVPRFFRN